MFLTDILRHVGAAGMAQFLGPTAANIAHGPRAAAPRRLHPRGGRAQIAGIAKRYGAEGARLVKALDAFLAGINAAQQQLCPLAFASPLPGRPGAASAPTARPSTPRCRSRRPTTPAPTSSTSPPSSAASSARAAAARWPTRSGCSSSQRKFGDAAGRKIYDDLREKNDPEAPTTSPFSLPLYGGGVDPSKPGVALPDLTGPVAPGTGADAGSSTPLPALPGLAQTRRRRRRRTGSWTGRSGRSTWACTRTA